MLFLFGPAVQCSSVYQPYIYYQKVAEATAKVVVMPAHRTIQTKHKNSQAAIQRANDGADAAAAATKPRCSLCSLVCLCGNWQQWPNSHNIKNGNHIDRNKYHLFLVLSGLRQGLVSINDIVEIPCLSSSSLVFFFWLLLVSVCCCLLLVLFSFFLSVLWGYFCFFVLLVLCSWLDTNK